MSNNNALINLGELSKPATVLIEKISEAVGGVFKPYQVIRVAKAEAEADRIRTESQIQITDLHRRAMHRFLEEEATKQSNIESITQQALPLLNDSASPESVADDWITNFFDKCRIVSGEDMQKLWARVLASEANSPGAFSRKTVNLIADLDKSDAELFTRLCSFGWMIGYVCPLVFNVQGEIYNRNGIDFGSMIHLESLGLIQFSGLTSFNRVRLPKKLVVFYYGRRVELTMPKDEDNELELGHVILTQAGQQLAPICGSTPLAEFFDFVYDTWAAKSYVPKLATEPSHAPEPAAGPVSN